MGPTESRNIHSTSRIKMNRNYFEFRHIIGKGGFGRVWKVIFKKNQKLYALKEMIKVKVLDRKSEKSIKTERDFLSKLHHPFIVNMIYAFQDFENLYLVMDLLTGGDLRFHISNNDTFTEEQTRLEYIHSNNIIHRDIKPENLVTDENGYIRITDFGIAKIVQPNNKTETSGTPGYMAPEVLCAQDHSYPVDFFAIGIMGYEFMLGNRPYEGRSRKEIKHEVLRRQAIIARDEVPNEWSMESVDFINSLLKRKPNKRLGYERGIQELKNHKWFDGFNWKDLMNKAMTSPFIPKGSCNYDKKFCEALDKPGQSTNERYQKFKNDDEFVSIFNGYTFINEQELSSLLLLSKHNTNASQGNFNTLDLGGNLSLNKDKRIFKLKPSQMIKRTLVLNNNVLSTSKPALLLRDTSKLRLFKGDTSSININSRNMIPSSTSNQTNTRLLKNNSMGSDLNYFVNVKEPNKIFQINSIPLIYDKRLEGSQSCKALSQLPVLKNRKNSRVKRKVLKLNSNGDINLNENRRLEESKGFKPKNKVILPISLSNLKINDNNNSAIKILHRSESVTSSITSIKKIKMQEIS